MYTNGVIFICAFLNYNLDTVTPDTLTVKKKSLFFFNYNIISFVKIS